VYAWFPQQQGWKLFRKEEFQKDALRQRNVKYSARTAHHSGSLPESTTAVNVGNMTSMSGEAR
jgi:hypothetical protein